MNRYYLRSSKFKLDNSDDESEENSDEIKVINNDIYFYCDVNAKTCLKLIEILKRLEIESLCIGIKFNIKSPNIVLHINSDGGEINSALAVVDTIRNSRVNINSIVEGTACSAATLISISCHNRQITQNSHMLIHQLSCEGFWGKMTEIEDEMKNLKRTMKVIKKLYNDFTKIDCQELPNILKKDLLWSSKKCLKLGLVDEII